jgi:hypothetical protein
VHKNIKWVQFWMECPWVWLSKSKIKPRWVSQNGAADSVCCRSRLLRQLAAQLAPAYLRVGGTLADRLVFQPDGSYSPAKHGSNVSDGGTCSYEVTGCTFQNTSLFNMTGTCRLRHHLLALSLSAPSHVQSVCRRWLDVAECICSSHRARPAVWLECVAEEWDSVGQLQRKTAAWIFQHTQIQHQLAAWKWSVLTEPNTRLRLETF